MNYCNWTAVQKALEAGPSLFGARNEMRTHVALVVLIVIAKHINRNSEETYLSYETIAEESLTSNASARRAVQSMVKSGHLIKKKGGSGKRDCNTYSFGPAMTETMDATEVTAVSKAEVAPTPRRSAKSKAAPSSTLPATEEARVLAERFSELEGGKPSAARVSAWQGTFDEMLGAHSFSDLLAHMEWVFLDGFWAPRIRTFSGDAVTYFLEHYGSIERAKAFRPPRSNTSTSTGKGQMKHSIEGLFDESTI